ncbi:MAG: hypothetical protein K2K90_17205 [Lachnospiraceae bacterium]|nr:hypothetical protein [Lachnospiraceae bacterium]
MWLSGGADAGREGVFVMHLMQRKGFNEMDAEYWKEKGWTGRKRPWR